MDFMEWFYREMLETDKRLAQDCINRIQRVKRWRFWQMMITVAWFESIAGIHFYNQNYWCALWCIVCCMGLCSWTWKGQDKTILMWRELKKMAASSRVQSEKRLAAYLERQEKKLE